MQQEGLRGTPTVHLLGDVGQSLHYIFPGIVARVANKSSGYELVDDLAGGHSAPEVGYDGFADGSLEMLAAMRRASSRVLTYINDGWVIAGHDLFRCHIVFDGITRGIGTGAPKKPALPGKP